MKYPKEVKYLLSLFNKGFVCKVLEEKGKEEVDRPYTVKELCMKLNCLISSKDLLTRSKINVDEYLDEYGTARIKCGNESFILLSNYGEEEHLKRATRRFRIFPFCIIKGTKIYAGEIWTTIRLRKFAIINYMEGTLPDIILQNNKFDPNVFAGRRIWYFFPKGKAVSFKLNYEKKESLLQAFLSDRDERPQYLLVRVHAV